MRRFLSFRDFDWALLSMVLAICTISVFEIYSATLHTKYADLHAHTKQLFWITGGLVAMFLFSKIDYHRLLDWIPWAYGASLLALVAVKLVGHKVLGAKRWISIGPMHFQPSEWVKLILILIVARYFANLGGRSLTWKEIFKALVLVGIPMALVLIQPDLGTALTYTPILVAGLFLGGINLRQALILVTCAVVLVAGVWTSGKILKPFQKARLTSFINPDNDPKGTGYQLKQSLIAVGSGGVWGKGAAKGTQTQGDFLPIPHADFIFAAFVEENDFRAAAILFHIDAFDSERSNSRGPVRLPDYHGGGGCVDFSDCGQRGHGHRVYARHRNPFAVNELRWIFGVVYVPGAGRGDECPHAPVRQLTDSQPHLLCPPEQSGPQEHDFSGISPARSRWIARPAGLGS
jgi:rod shape determining protein RodA